MSAATDLREKRQAEILNRERAQAIALAVNPRAKTCHLTLSRVRDQIEQNLDPKTLRDIHRRYLRLSPADRDSFTQLQNDGAHSSTLLQFIGATQDHELAERPTRDRIYRDFQQRRAKQKGARPMEIAARVIAPTLFVSTCALVVPWLAAKAAVATGTALTLAGPIQAALEPIAQPILELIAAESDGWISRTGLVLGAWIGWGYAARVLPDLKQTMAEPETQVLDSALGPGNRPWGLHGALRKIPGPDRHLLAHLLPAELRAFLRADKRERRDILSSHPPPLMAEVRSLMATHPPGLVNFWRLSRDLGDLCLPQCWRQGPFLNPRLDLESRLERWHKHRPDAARLDAEEMVALVSSRVRLAP